MQLDTPYIAPSGWLENYSKHPRLIMSYKADTALYDIIKGCMVGPHATTVYSTLQGSATVTSPHANGKLNFYVMSTTARFQQWMTELKVDV